jgi:Mn2+/Fe2+ NRAMP family transporter
VAYVGSAFLSKPDVHQVLRGSLIPTITFSRDFLTIAVAVIGTTLSAYLFRWKSNEEVEEKIAAGQRTVAMREGATEGELATTGLV